MGGEGPRRPTVVVWQFCIHTSTAGEAVTMITRFLHAEFDIRFHGNSVAVNLCGNYYPSLCAPPEDYEFVDWVSSRIIKRDMPYHEVLQRFEQRLLGTLQEADVWMCSIPVIFCKLLHDVARVQQGV